MDSVPPWFLGVVVLAVVAAVVGVALLWFATFIGRCFPEPENRPMPLERMADLEHARDEALRKIQQRQRGV